MEKILDVVLVVHVQSWTTLTPNTQLPSDQMKPLTDSIQRFNTLRLAWRSNFGLGVSESSWTSTHPRKHGIDNTAQILHPSI
ncbi:protein of unknown function (plasmid) [Cupriavidus taiwanensis]|uniref:Uncharacterized protein n=1 Tax=Cupriavidus taiwanensis TaxID=164546 RepID=A0A9Q7UZE3_9BURK|nr:protein of unknown function [Cupriavidus taiwanensis]